MVTEHIKLTGSVFLIVNVGDISTKTYLYIFVKVFKIQKLRFLWGQGRRPWTNLLSPLIFSFPIQIKQSSRGYCRGHFRGHSNVSNVLWTVPTDPPFIVKWKSPRPWEWRGNWRGEYLPNWTDSKQEQEVTVVLSRCAACPFTTQFLSGQPWIHLVWGWLSSSETSLKLYCLSSAV